MPTTRRGFLKGMAASGAAMTTARSLPASQDRTLDAMFREALVIDDLAGFTPDPAQPDRGFGAIDRSGVTVVSPTIGSVVAEESYESSVSGLAQLASTVAANSDRMLLIRGHGDVERARNEGKLGVLVNFQNSTALGTDLNRLDLFYGLGLRQMQITFNWRNWVGDGCTERTQAGLSYFGVDLVEKMNGLGVIVDVGHTGSQTTLDAIEVSKKPIVFSHTNCKAICDHPRNKTDEQIVALAKKGGVMGMTTFNWFVSDKPRSTLDDLLDHYDHAIRLVGADHVAIGSDFSLPGWKGREPDEEWERHAGLYGEREWKALKGRFPPYIDEVNDERRYWTIAQGLEKRGHSVSDIEKILGLNFLRVYKEVLKS
ncbi:MAG: dipeptidase [Vicinamibacteria bacterium]